MHRHQDALYHSPDWLDLHFNAKRDHRARTAKLFDLRRGDRVLDVGCGSGAWTEIFLNSIGYNGEVIGIDPLPGNIERARRKATLLDVSNVQYRGGQADDLSTIEGRFDVIHLGNVAGYFPNCEKLFRSLRARLRPGGRLIVRQHDEGAFLLYPVREALLARIKAAIALERERLSSEKTFDLYAGRHLGTDLDRSGFRRVDRRVIPFEAVAPFEISLQAYIRATCKWMLEAAGPSLVEAERLEWESAILRPLAEKTAAKAFYMFEIEYLYHAYIA